MQIFMQFKNVITNIRYFGLVAFCNFGRRPEATHGALRVFIALILTPDHSGIRKKSVNFETLLRACRKKGCDTKPCSNQKIKEL